MSDVQRLTPERLAEIDQGLKEYVEKGLGAYDPVLYARELRDAYDALARQLAEAQQRITETEDLLDDQARKLTHLFDEQKQRAEQTENDGRGAT